MCGEKGKEPGLIQKTEGSPPRVRGKERLLPEKHTSSGITPAYAGKRRPEYGRKNKCGDHPRVCGEKNRQALVEGANQGSPPRMRGKEVLPVRGFPPPGITPAYAGKRTGPGKDAPRRWDHPRVCGEKEIAAGRDVAYWGSPPRMRGKARSCQTVQHGAGITPAYAGKSSPGSAAGCHARDHPRVCGEKFAARLLPRFIRGSPPRMRGKV